MSKEYVIFVGGKRVPVNEDVYRAYMRPVWAEKRRKRHHAEQGDHILSLDSMLEDGFDPASDLQVEDVVEDKMLLGSVSVMPLVYRLVCLNGMVVNDLGQRKYHVGRENEEAWDLFRDETLQADDAAFMMKLADIVRTAVDEARFGMVVDKLREAAEVKLDGDIPQIVELTARQFGITKPEENDVMKHLIEGGDLSLYGLSGAVTRAAQDAEDYDRATELESVGWQIATMPSALWQMVNGREAV